MNKVYTFILVILGIIPSTLANHLLSAPSNNLIPRSVLFNNPERANPKISPDGKLLAYYAPFNGVLNIWVQTIGKDDALPVTNETVREVEDYCWSCDSKQILYRQDSNGDENYHIYGAFLSTSEIRDYTPFIGVKAKILATNKLYPDTVLIEMNKETRTHFDVYTLNLNTGTLMLEVKNPGNVLTWRADNNLKVRAAIATHPDGKQSLLLRNDETDSFRTLMEFDFEDTISDELYCGLLEFSADGKSLYLNTSLGNNTRSLVRVNLQTGTQTILATDQFYDICTVHFDATHYPRIVFWNKERCEHRVLDAKFEKDFASMRSVSNGDLDYLQHNDDEMKWVLGFVHDNKSYEYYLYDRQLKQATFLFHARPSLANYTLSSMKPITLTARDELKIHGYLTCPTTTNSLNLPMVLLVHGGPFMRDVWGYDRRAQWLASRGYACLQINYRGSSGYGKEFLAAGNLEWGNKMHFDLVDGIQWAVNEGIADPKRIAIFGGSYGGYAALVGATFTPDLFRCAIDYVGPCNLITLLKSLPPYWSISQWEKRIGSLSDEAFLKSRSPLFKIDQIKIPIFVAHGAHDARVTVAESEQLVAALKKKGLPHEYLVFDDEGHGFARPENRMIFYAAVEKFLAQHLGGVYET